MIRAMYGGVFGEQRVLLLEGLKWRVGNGEKIGVWEEAWLPGDSSTNVPTPNIESLVDLRVSDLVDTNGEWDITALDTHFTAEEALLIREIPLSERRPEEFCRLMPTFKSWRPGGLLCVLDEQFV